MATKPRFGGRVVAGAILTVLVAALLSSAGWALSSTSATTTSTADLFSAATPPAGSASNDPLAVTLGVKFRVTVAGDVRGIRFYKGPGNDGVHVGDLWTSKGEKLAEATFASETDSGWQEVTFASPVTIAADTTYVASYFAPSGRYSDTQWYFQHSGHNEGPLQALSDPEGNGNGVYEYGSNGFPTFSWDMSNYWVDVNFSPTPAPGSTTTGRGTTAPSNPTKKSPSKRKHIGSPATKFGPGSTTQPGTTNQPGTTSPPTTASPTATEATTTIPDTTTDPATTTTTTTVPPPTTTTVVPTIPPTTTSQTTLPTIVPNGETFPTAANTGVPPGTALTPYTGPNPITACGTVIDSKIINGGITITASNGTYSSATPCVTIKNSSITGVVSDGFGGAGPLLITDSEIIGQAGSATPNLWQSNWYGWRLNIHGGRGQADCDGWCELHDSYVHDEDFAGGTHMQAFETNGSYGAPVLLDHNSFICDPHGAPTSGGGCAADVSFFGDNSAVTNTIVNNNLFMASPGDFGFCVYTGGYEQSKAFPDGTNLVWTNNTFQRGPSGQCGDAGPVADWVHNAGNVWSGNVWDDGTPLNL